VWGVGSIGTYASYHYSVVKAQTLGL